MTHVDADKGPRPYHTATPRMAVPPSERRFSALEWQTPKYPGDAVLSLLLRKGDELGDVRVQWYKDDALRVAAFLPGYETSFPGDTPKMNPERDEWVTTREEASRVYVQYIIAAFRDGWAVYDRERG